MQTLNEIYNEIAQCEERWSYYDECKLSITNVWCSDDCSLDFIKDYFDLAGKGGAFDDDYLKKKEKSIKGQAQHTISTFLLAVKLSDILGIDIDECESADEFNFKYYLFLACFYHDVGYVVEDNKANLGLLRSVYNKGVSALKCELIRFTCKNVYKTYPKEIVEMYLKGRASDDEHRGIDHGIVGGLMLYSKLREQYRVSWKEHRVYGNYRDFIANYNGRWLHLSKEHFPVYAKVADAIISHNIYKDTLIKYVEEAETEVHVEYKKISRNNEVAFILAIADTIEPLKRGIDLNRVSIKKVPGGFRIGIEINGSGEENRWLNGIMSLSDWIDVDVVPTDCKDNFKVFDVTIPDYEEALHNYI